MKTDSDHTIDPKNQLIEPLAKLQKILIIHQVR